MTDTEQAHRQLVEKPPAPRNTVCQLSHSDIRALPPANADRKFLTSLHVQNWPGTSNISITGELTRNLESQACPVPSESEPSLLKGPGDASAHHRLGSTAAEDSGSTYWSKYPVGTNPLARAYRAHWLLKPGTFASCTLKWGWDTFADWVCCRKEVFCYQGREAEQEHSDRYPINLFLLSYLSSH